MTLPPQDALARLRAGNARYVSEKPVRVQSNTADLRASLTGGQAPFAVVLGCSDSRVPVEEVFDQAAGDLFVIRVAGNIATPSQVGSAEFGVDVLGCRLVVVLGHTACGAIQAALAMLDSDVAPESPNLGSVIDEIRPALEGLELGSDEPDGAREVAAVRANVRAVVGRLTASSDSLRASTESGDLMIVGAEYVLDTGEVLFTTD